MNARAAVAVGLLWPLSACLGPPPSHALVVRNLELKCALIAFSGCAAFASEPEPFEPEYLEQPDAGAGDDDAGSD